MLLEDEDPEVGDEEEGGEGASKEEGFGCVLEKDEGGS